MVRTSFTQKGGVHPGTGRLAVFSWLFVRHSGGEFRLRIEDTDTEIRTAPGNSESPGDLKWLGLDWDNEVIRQSVRLPFYDSIAARLVKEGRAYPCYCTLQEIEERNKTKPGHQHHYDGKCRNLTTAEIKIFENEGRTPSIRFIAYDEEFTYRDIHKGNVSIPSGTVGDFIILRSNKTPIGFFAEAADHFEAGITHLFKNEEHVSATIRALMLCKALGMVPPVVFYLPALTDTEGRKLQNGENQHMTGLDDLREKGYLPEAVFNFLALLGWNSPDGRELFGRDELVQLFAPEGLSGQPAVFDPSKLDWISRHFIINESLEKIFEQTLPFFKNSPRPVKELLENPEKKEVVRNTVDLVRGYCGTLSEIREHANYFLTDEFPFCAEAENLLRKKETGKVLSAFADWVRSNGRNMDENLFGEMIAELSKKTGLHGKVLYHTLKAALTGRTDGPDIHYLVPVIGTENTLKRIETASTFSRQS